MGLHEQNASLIAASEAMRQRAAAQREQIMREAAEAEAALVPRASVEQAASRLAEAEAALEDARAGLGAAERSRAQGEQENSASALQLAAVLAEQARLQAQLEGLAPFPGQTGGTDELPFAEGGQGGGWQRLADLMLVPPGLERAVGAALADGLNAALDAAAPRHWRELDARSSSRLPEGAVPLSDLVGAPAALMRAMTHAGLVEEADGAALQAALEPGQSLVSRSGSIWRWDGYSDSSGLSAEGSAAQAARALEQRRRLRETSARLQAIDTESARPARAGG